MRIAVVRHVLAYSRSSCKNAIFARCVHSRTSKRRSLYDVLDVSHSATQAEIKAAYYELSMKYHPDVNKSEEAQHKFTELTKAYSVLSNLNSRREYDKEIGAYFTMRSTKRKAAGEKVLRLTDEMLEIDVSGIRESGVFLSTIATLSTIMSVPVRMTNVAITKGGVQSHDMRVLQLLRTICNGTLAANIGLSTVTYIPGELLSGNFSAEAGRLGQLSLLVAAVLPCLPFAPVPEYTHYNRIFLKGSTHRSGEIHSDYIQSVTLPFTKNFGFDFSYDIRKRSYYPFWEGKVCIESLPVYNLSAIDMTESGTVRKVTGWTFVGGDKPMRIAQVMSKEVHRMLKDKLPGIPVNIDSRRDQDSRREGTGQGVILLAEMSSGLVLSGTALWKKGMTPDQVVYQAVRMLLYNVKSGTCVDDMLQDQAILLMSLASGKSSLRVSPLNKRSKSVMKAIEAFTEVRFNVVPSDGKTGKSVLVECEGQGRVNEDVVPPDHIKEKEGAMV